MDKQSAIRMIRDTLEKPFDKDKFAYFARNLFKRLDTTDPFMHRGNLIPDAYESYVGTFERIGQYKDAKDNEVDVLVAHLKKEESLERARTMQRNFIARYLNGSRGGKLKDAALVAFVSPDQEDWRFSLVKMDYVMEEGPGGKTKLKTELTPARRWSFLVGQNESSHTAQTRLVHLLQMEELPLLSQLEEAFNVEVVTREFFERYRQLFWNVDAALQTIIQTDQKVAGEFASRGINTENFSKKLLGQIVFLYFLQKKGWFGVARDAEWGTGPKNFLRLLFEKNIAGYSNFFDDILEPLFYNTLALERRDDFADRFNCKIPFLNGGLFDPMNGYNWVHPDIPLPNGLFSSKKSEDEEGSGILDVFDLYNFTVKEDEPLEKEVAIDPEMLGKVFENLLEVKDRKSKGTYYTPREIVHYMCQESLVNYLDTAVNSGEVALAQEKQVNLKLFGAPATRQMAMKTDGYTGRAPREDIESFIHKGELAIQHDARVEEEGKETKRYSYRLPESIRANAALFDEKLAGIRVCDPAIGSGAFPVGIMTEIVRARHVLSTYLGTDNLRSHYEFKRHAIQNCLYGVDIDPGAVEIARLRLWLSLVVDEDDIREIRPLPNLDYKIVCGNSLLGVERNIFNNHLFHEIEELKEHYRDETNVNKKPEYKDHIDLLLKEVKNQQPNFDFQVYFSEVFHEKGGFDVVIANPPYVRQEQIKEFKAELKNQYEECYSGLADIFVYFYARGLRLLREGGILTFISSNKYFRSGYGEKLRRFLGNKATICQVIDFGDAPVFEAIAYPSIIILRKSPPADNQSRVFTWKPGPPLEEFAAVVDKGSFLIAQRELTADGWRLESPAVLRLLEKLRKAGKPLGEYVNGRFYRGIVTGLNGAFVVDRATRDRLIAEHKSSAEVLKPFLRGRDVKRWRVEPQDLWLVFTRHGINIKKYPAIHAHLEKFRKELMPKPANWDEDKKGAWPGRKPGSYQWYEIQDNIAYWREFEQPKIVYPDIAARCEFALDQSSIYPDCTLFMVPEGSLYLLGVLNSTVNRFFFPQICPKVRGDFMRFKSIYVEQIPIPATDNLQPVEALVDRILAIKGASPDADGSGLERQIDQLVYKLYGLTTEEIAVVEGRP